MTDAVITIVAIAVILGICALLLFYPPRRVVAPRRRPDYGRITQLERELGLAPKPPRPPGIEALNASTYESLRQIREAGYEAVEVTQFGDSKPRYARGQRLPEDT